jgi:hypothetical protein
MGFKNVYLVNFLQFVIYRLRKQGILRIIKIQTYSKYLIIR